MTQQYIAGEFSALLGDLHPAAGESVAAVRALRREVETSPPSRLGRLASDAVDLTDMICWTALEQGDASGFSRCATTAVALREFAASANLLS